jgi:hypothetical protein
MNVHDKLTNPNNTNLRERDLILSNPLESVLGHIETSQSLHSRLDPNFLLDSQILKIEAEYSEKRRKRGKKRPKKSVVVATGMVVSLKRMMKKAKKKIEAEKDQVREISMTETVQIGKKDDVLKIGHYLKDNTVPNYKKKLIKVESHIKGFYKNNTSTAPMDILTNISETPVLVNVIRFKLNPKSVRNIFTTRGQEKIFKQAQKLRKARYNFDYRSKNEPKMQGKMTIKESNTSLLNGYFKNQLNKSRKQRVSSGGGRKARASLHNMILPANLT